MIKQDCKSMNSNGLFTTFILLKLLIVQYTKQFYYNN